MALFCRIVSCSSGDSWVVGSTRHHCKIFLVQLVGGGIFCGILVSVTSRVEFFPTSRKNANKIQVEKSTGYTTFGGIFTVKYVYFR